MAQLQLSFHSVREPGFKHPMLNVNTNSWRAVESDPALCPLLRGEASEKITFLAAPQTTDIWSYKTF